MLKSEKRKYLIEELQKTVQEQNQCPVLQGFIKTKELAVYLGKKDPAAARPFVYGAQKIGTRYFIPDVVENMLERGSY